MNAAKARIREIEERGYNFALGTYLERGLNIFGRQPGLFIAFTLVYMVIMGFSNIIPIVGPLAASILLSPCLIAGFYLVARKIDSGERNIEFGDFFKGFDYLGKLATVAVLTSLILAASAIPLAFFGTTIAFSFSFAVSYGDFSAFPFWIFLFLIPTIYLAISYAAAPFFVVFYDMEGWEAMKASRKVISQKWFTVFGFSIVLSLIAALGFVALFVGILAAVPIIFCAEYAAFADIMKLDRLESDDDEVMRHLV